MSRKSLDEFAFKLALTPEWVEASKKKQAEAGSRAEFLAWLAAFAAEQGFEVSPEDVDDMNREYNSI
ncbi:MAG: hypothetical protein AB7F40_06905 [Victivallaceae bacterium]|nr:hypothetical protein [Victivallaceae bacterium]